ncbi:unnamed protein product [Echinostoma caproni]|uniref:Spectrin beta chain n=1 Tax=Echinostoma caproni TaxID=27848 RepID=A0A183B0R1_9TREM|nr:unnamed protein product [Echinostoma caproni]
MKVDQMPDLDGLERRYWLIHHTVEERWAQINAQKHYHQLLRDLEDEQIWIRERITVASNQDVGRSLLAVNQLIRRHRLLIKEVSGRDERVEVLLKEADNILTQWRSKQSQSSTLTDKTRGTDEVLVYADHVRFRLPTKVLQDLAQICTDIERDRVELRERLEQRTFLLDVGYRCLKHLTDFGELCAWLQETEAVVLLESRASRDTVTAKAELRKHANVEQRVTGLLAASVRDFSEFRILP